MSIVSALIISPDILLCWVCANCRWRARSLRDSGTCVPSRSPPDQICSRKYWSPYLWKTRVDSFLDSYRLLLLRTARARKKFQGWMRFSTRNKLVSERVLCPKMKCPGREYFGGLVG